MVTLKEIQETQDRIRDVAIRTPILPVKFFDRPDTFVKCENLQRGGAFKIRGAYNKISRLGQVNGVVAYSSGNHAQAVALASKMLGVKATIVMLDQCVRHKLEQTKAYGAEVILGGNTSQSIKERAEQIAKEREYEIVRPFDDPQVIMGAGTVGLEILQDLEDVKSVCVPIGGGGLCAGVVTAIKESNPRIKVFGIEPEGAPKMYKSREAGELVTLPGTDTVADGLKPVRGGDLTFPIITNYIDDLILVSDREILETSRHLILKEKLVVEPSGAASLAAIRHRRVTVPDGPAVAILSGGNADISMILNSATS
jgi:threonine dehydratase